MFFHYIRFDSGAPCYADAVLGDALGASTMSSTRRVIGTVSTGDTGNREMLRAAQGEELGAVLDPALETALGAPLGAALSWDRR